MAKTKYIYRAGILDRMDDWIWQGEVVAYNIIQAKKLLKGFQKKYLRTTCRIEVDSISKEKTMKKMGVYD